MVEVSFHECDGLGKGGRADRGRNRRDDEQESEIGRQAQQSVTDGRAGEGQKQRRDARPPVDPRTKRRGEGDSADGSGGQDGAKRKRGEVNLVDKKQHDIRAGDRIREAGEHVDDDERDEEGRSVDVGCHGGPCGRRQRRPTRPDGSGPVEFWIAGRRRDAFVGPNGAIRKRGERVTSSNCRDQAGRRLHFPRWLRADCLLPAPGGTTDIVGAKAAPSVSGQQGLPRTRAPWPISSRFPIPMRNFARSSSG